MKEIRAALLAHPGVKDATVIVDEDTLNLKACIVSHHEPPEKRNLHQFARQYLPNYMLPSQYVFLDSIPLNAHGKIDRHRLASYATEEVIVEHIQPQTKTEKKLHQIWTELLSNEKISIHENFFLLGGHSLNAASMKARIQRDFKIEISLHILFEFATIFDLAIYIELLQGTHNSNYDIT